MARVRALLPCFAGHPAALRAAGDEFDMPMPPNGKYPEHVEVLVKDKKGDSSRSHTDRVNPKEQQLDATTATPLHEPEEVEEDEGEEDEDDAPKKRRRRR